MAVPSENVVKEDLLANILHLVVWFHEHKCLADLTVRAVAHQLKPSNKQDEFS